MTPSSLNVSTLKEDGKGGGQNDSFVEQNNNKELFMKIKKLASIFVSFMLAAGMALSLVACTEEGGKIPENPDSGTTKPDDGNGDKTDPVQLIAPVISLNDGVISWSAVAHASAYEVYENDSLASRQTATMYTVTRTAVGEYVYKVRAISANSSYTTSEFSNTETYTVEPKVEPAVPLTAPAIELKDNVITWSAVTNATAYEIYENGVKVGQVKTTSYTITTTLAGKWNYTVVAISSDTVHYEPSAPSNAVEYTVTATAVNYVITVTVPSGYTSPVQVALYKQGETTPVETKPVTVSGGQGRVEFSQSNEFIYTASVVTVPAGFKATTARLTASNTEGEIRIININGSDIFKVGMNSFTVTNNDQVGADKIYYFLPEKDGVYTLDASLESKSMYISVDRNLYIDNASEMSITPFRATAGVLMEITVVGFEMGSFSFEIVEGEVKQDLRIGLGYGSRPNYIFGDGTRNLEVESIDYYVFEFGLMSLAGRTITLTIDGKNYVFGGFDEETSDVQNSHVIPLNKGVHEVTITTTGFALGDEMMYCVLCIYQGNELKSAN